MFPGKRTIGLLLFVAGLGITGLNAQNTIPFVQGDSIEQIREKIRQNGYNFTVGETWVYRLSAEQKAKIFRTRVAPPMDKRAILPFTMLKSASKGKPASFDWRSYNGHSYIGPVRDQGFAGTCYAFGACAAAETTYNFKKGIFDSECMDFSESYIVWTLGSTAPYSEHFGGDGADYEYYELYGLTKNGPPEGATGIEGVCSELNFPYRWWETPTQSVIDQSKTYPRITFKHWARVYPQKYEDTTEQIKTAISTYGTVDAAIYADDAFSAYTGGIYEDSNTKPDEDPYYFSRSNHAIALVGWDDDPNGDGNTGDGSWILRNSWGRSWGEAGYMRIKYFSAGVNFAAAFMVVEGDGPYSISGKISGEVQEGVTVTLSGDAADFSISASDGTYSLSGLVDGSYTVIPSKKGYNFNPASTAVTISGASQTGTDFTSSSFPVTLTMAVSPDQGGTTNPSGTVQTQSAQTVEIEAIPNEGFEFKFWSLTAGDATIADIKAKATTVSSFGDATVTAFFIYPIKLEKDIPVKESTTDGYKLFYFEIPEGKKAVRICASSNAPTLDSLDLGVNLPSVGAYPSSTFESSSSPQGYSFSGDETVVFFDPPAGKYYILVEEYDTGGDFTITATSFDPSPGSVKSLKMSSTYSEYLGKGKESGGSNYEEHQKDKYSIRMKFDVNAIDDAAYAAIGKETGVSFFFGEWFPVGIYMLPPYSIADLGFKKLGNADKTSFKGNRGGSAVFSVKNFNSNDRLKTVEKISLKWNNKKELFVTITGTPLDDSNYNILYLDGTAGPIHDKVETLGLIFGGLAWQINDLNLPYDGKIKVKYVMKDGTAFELMSWNVKGKK